MSGLNFCSSGWLQSPTSYSCIKFYREEKSWFDARSICQAVNGDLMINIDDMKQNLIAAQRKSFEPEEEFWFGLNDRKNEGDFKWLDGTETISKTYWMDDQPNNWRGDQHCGAYRNPRSNIAKWNDQRCSKRLKFVCEVFPDCPGNTFLEEGVQTSVIKHVVEPTTPAKDMMDSVLTAANQFQVQIPTNVNVSSLNKNILEHFLQSINKKALTARRAHEGHPCGKATPANVTHHACLRFGTGERQAKTFKTQYERKK
ncbi:hypothetical protein RRG08_065037 [Elysia crispata]|uniref:C-type lectin domain-containing protein n=1 Tax=Elysia crispata TaxID=231223 RepID=A0AAE1DLY6_9GAST|nr:hypothetical protein RRG08_065037 [Elysia crispata]